MTLLEWVKPTWPKAETGEPPPPLHRWPRRWGALEGLWCVRNLLWAMEEGETHRRGVSMAAGGRPVRCVGEMLEEQCRWKPEWSPRHKVTRRSSWQRWRVRRGMEMAGTGKELVADGADSTMALQGLLAAYGGSKTRLLLRGNACAHGRWLGDA
jgi:hypothetical protein